MWCTKGVSLQSDVPLAFIRDKSALVADNDVAYSLTRESVSRKGVKIVSKKKAEIKNLNSTFLHLLTLYVT